MIDISKSGIKYLCAVILVCISTGWLSSAQSQGRALVVAGNQQFKVELAQTQTEREKGLMLRQKLDTGEGMLFVMPESTPVAIWMKNMLISLDVVWISDNGEVLAVIPLNPCIEDPCPQHRPSRAAKYILEVNQGTFPLQVGNTVEIETLSGDSLLPRDKAYRRVLGNRESE